jgi:hypothetical protein
MYIKSGSIQPTGFFQQVTRTRNIDTLYYYDQMDTLMTCMDIYPEHIEKRETIKKTIIESAFKTTLDDVKEQYRNMIHLSNTLYDVCVNLDTNDNESINENTFFELFCYNEYVKHIYNKNKLFYFNNILTENGFVLSIYGKYRELSERLVMNMKRTTNKVNDELFQDYLDATSEERELDLKFNVLHEKIKNFHLLGCNNEKIEKLKPYLTNKFKVDEIVNINRIIKSADYISNKIILNDSETFKVKCYDDVYHKILLLHNIIGRNKMKLFDFSCAECNITDKEYEQAKAIFKWRKEKPNDTNSSLKFIVNIYNEFLPNNPDNPELDIIYLSSKQKRIESKRTWVYTHTTNFDNLNMHLNIINDLGFLKEDTIHDDIKDKITVKFETIDFIDDTTNEPDIIYECQFCGVESDKSFFHSKTCCKLCGRKALD